MPSCTDSKPTLTTVYYKADGEPLYHKVTQSVIRHEGKILQQSKKAELSHKNSDSGLAFTSDGKMTIVQKVSEASALSACKPYSPVHPRDVSLSSCINDTRNDYCLAFTCDFSATPDFQSLKEEGDYVVLAVMPIYHANVFWMYALDLVREGDQLFLKLSSVHHDLKKDEYQFASMPYCEAPPKLIDAELELGSGEEKCKMEFFRKPDEKDEEGGAVFYVPQALTESELRRFYGHSDKLDIRIRLMVPRSFFDYKSNYFASHDREMHPSAPENVRKMVDAIVKGKTGGMISRYGMDLKIRGSSDCYCHSGLAGSIFYVHESAFLNAEYVKDSPLLNDGFGQLADGFKGHSKGERARGIEILIGSGSCDNCCTCGRCGKMALCDPILRVAIPMVYGCIVPLPVRGTVTSKFMDALWPVFKGSLFVLLVRKHWSREICIKVVEMDVRDPSSSMVELLHLLHITCYPKGWLPVARTAAIGVLADMAHLNAGSSVQQWVVEEVLPYLEESGCGSEYVGGILTDFYQMMNTVPAVEKKVVPLVAGVWGS